MSDFTKEGLEKWLREELRDIASDKKSIDASDMPALYKGLDWVCAVDTKIAKILDKLGQPKMYEALQAAQDHLEYCGYGDEWEREGADASGLPHKIQEALSQGK